jgi:transcriptional regulator with XRE-family HTH domain
VAPSRAAIEAGISKSLVTKWRTTNIKMPSPEVLEKLSNYFSVPVSELLGEEVQKNNPPDRLEPTEREMKILEALRSKTPAERKALLTLLGIAED